MTVAKEERTDPLLGLLNACGINVETSKAGTLVSSKEARKDILNIPKKHLSDRSSKDVSK